MKLNCISSQYKNAPIIQSVSQQETKLIFPASYKRSRIIIATYLHDTIMAAVAHRRDSISHVAADLQTPPPEDATLGDEDDDLGRITAIWQKKSQQIEHLRSKNLSLSINSVQKDEEFTKVTDDLQHCRNSVTSLEAQITNLQEDLEKERTKVASASKESAEARAHFATIGKDTKTQRKSQDKVIEALREENRSLSVQVTNLTSELARYIVTSEDSKKQRQECLDLKAGLEMKLANSVSALANSQAAEIKSASDLSAWESCGKRANSQIDGLEKKIEQNETEIQVLKSTEAAFRFQNDTYAQQLKNLEDKCKGLQDENEDMRNAADQLRDVLNERFRKQVDGSPRKRSRTSEEGDGEAPWDRHCGTGHMSEPRANGRGQRWSREDIGRGINQNKARGGHKGTGTVGLAP